MTAWRMAAGIVSVVAGVEGDALAVELGAEQGAAQGGGDGAGAGDEVDGEPREGVQQGSCSAGAATACPGRAGGQGVAAGVGAGDQGDHLADDGPVGAAGDDGDDEGVAGGGLGVLVRQVWPVLAGAGAQPGVLDRRRRPGIVPQGRQDRDDDVDAGVGARPGRAPSWRG